MSSRKPSARRRATQSFLARLDTGETGANPDAFAREANRVAADAAHHEEALRSKACESKRRYATRADAKASVAVCEKRGAPALYIYRCPYCGGWHLTHRRPRG